MHNMYKAKRTDTRQFKYAILSRIIKSQIEDACKLLSWSTAWHIIVIVITAI